MKKLSEWAIRIGNWLVLWGVRRAKSLGAFELLSGDHLTRLGALVGCVRETDAEFRERCKMHFEIRTEHGLGFEDESV